MDFIRGYQYIASVIFAAVLLHTIVMAGGRNAEVFGVLALAFAFSGAYVGELMYSTGHNSVSRGVCIVLAIVFTIVAIACGANSVWWFILGG